MILYLYNLLSLSWILTEKKQDLDVKNPDVSYSSESWRRWHDCIDLAMPVFEHLCYRSRSCNTTTPQP